MSGTPISESTKNWVQTIAICLAGFWALYEFVLSEERLDLGLALLTEIEVKEPVFSPNVSGSVVPVDFSIEVENTGDKTGQILIAYLVIFGANFADSDGYSAPHYQPESDISILDVRDLDWIAEVEEIGRAFVLPGQVLPSKGKVVARPTLLISDAAQYDIFLYDVAVWALEPCQGTFPFESCSAFQLAVDGYSGEGCEGEALYLFLCGRFSKYEKDISEAVRVTFAQLEKENEAVVWTDAGFFYISTSDVKTEPNEPRNASNVDDQ
ncbi:MAG: hypothetical protein AB3N15_07580 [Paracoccaceae bacterium]